MPAEHVDALCAVLGDETRTCAALVVVLRDEQRAMVALRAEAIFSSLERRLELESELARLAERRRALVREIACACGLSAGSATGLLRQLAPALQGRLATRLRELRAALLAARALERQNALLAASSLDGLGELLQALRALAPGARYGADAQIDAPRALERVDRRI
jgi:hypothetical protein